MARVKGAQLKAWICLLVLGFKVLGFKFQGEARQLAGGQGLHMLCQWLRAGMSNSNCSNLILWVYAHNFRHL